jgi:hypothetical protein
MAWDLLQLLGKLSFLNFPKLIVSLPLIFRAMVQLNFHLAQI